MLGEVPFDQIGAEGSEIERIVVIHVPNNINGPHFKRKKRFRPTERRLFGRLVFKDTTYWELRKTVPSFGGQLDSAIGEKIRFPFSGYTLHVGLSLDEYALVLQARNGSGNVGARNGDGVGDSHLRECERNFDAVLKVGIIQQMQENALLHPGLSLAYHPCDLGFQSLLGRLIVRVRNPLVGFLVPKPAWML